MIDEIYIPGLGDISSEVEAEFRRGFHAEAVLAEKRQREAAEARRALGIEASDELLVSVDPFWYHYWGQREGYEIWADRKEVERFMRDTPELRIERPKNRVSFAGVGEAVLIEGRPVGAEERLKIDDGR